MLRKRSAFLPVRTRFSSSLELAGFMTQASPLIAEKKKDDRKRAQTEINDGNLARCVVVSQSVNLLAAKKLFSSHFCKLLYIRDWVAVDLEIVDRSNSSSSTITYIIGLTCPCQSNSDYNFST